MNPAPPLLRSHTLALPAAPPPVKRKRGRPKGSKNIVRPKPYDLPAADAERARIREDAKQASKNRSLGWEQRRAAKQLAQSLAAAEYQAERKITAGAHLCRCLNPDCLVWFASWRKNSSACSKECKVAVDWVYRNWAAFITAPVKCLAKHARTVSRRNAGLYDTPKLTPYAIRLVMAADQDSGTGLDAILHAATLAAESRTRGLASGILDGTRERRFARQEDGDTFSDFYLLGSSLAANYPYRPCDHSGLRSCHSPVKHYNTTTTP
jgi:hypothetical protein